MTEDSQSRRQGDGPSSEGAEPTEPTAAQTPDPHPHPGASVTPPAPHIPAQRIPGGPVTGVPPAAPPADSDPPPSAPADPYAFDQPIYRPGAPDPDPPSYFPQQSFGPSSTSGPFPSAAPGDPAYGDPAAPPRRDLAYGSTSAAGPGITAAATPAPGGPGVGDLYGFAPPPGRRIEPSPPPDRGRLYLGALAGLLAGLLIFGTAGWFVGRATAPTADADPAPTKAQELGIFEQNQVAINEPDFAGTALTTIAQGWLPYLATCTRNGSPGGPALSPGEKTRVRCTLDGMSAIFVEYASIAERDKARTQTIAQGDAASLAQGAAPPAERKAPSARTEGNYVEYAYRLTERGTTRTVSGLWWDDAQAPVAGYLLAYWKDGVGESWAPMRDLWSRYA